MRVPGIPTTQLQIEAGFEQRSISTVTAAPTWWSGQIRLESFRMFSTRCGKTRFSSPDDGRFVAVGGIFRAASRKTIWMCFGETGVSHTAGSMARGMEYAGHDSGPELQRPN